MSCAPARRCVCPSRPISIRWRRPSPTPRCGGTRTSGRTAPRGRPVAALAACGDGEDALPPAPSVTPAPRPADAAARGRRGRSGGCSRRRAPRRGPLARDPQRRVAQPPRWPRPAPRPRRSPKRRSRIPASRSNRSNCSPTKPTARARRRDARACAGSALLRRARYRAVVGIASDRLARVTAVVDRLGRRGAVADGGLVRAAPASRDRGRDGPLGGPAIGDRRRSSDARRDGAPAPSRCPSRRSSSRSSTRISCARQPSSPSTRPRAARRRGRRKWFPPTRRFRAKPSSISTKRTPSPRRTSISLTASTTKRPSSCRERSRPRPIGAT